MEGSTFVFTSECVTDGHPDKVADNVVDAILDACLAQDCDSKVAVEACVRSGMIMVLGEVSTMAKVDYDAAIREVCKQIGYDSVDVGLDYRTMEVLNKVDPAQSPDVAQAVHGHFSKPLEDLGAGDQGIICGYATDETPELMPLTQALACKICQQLSKLRLSGALPWLRPDGRAQVTVEYVRKASGALAPQRLHTVVLVAQHAPDVDLDVMNQELLDKVVKSVCPAELLDDDTICHVNPAGCFVSGGPSRTTGISGRRLAADTYGGWGAHSCGSFSGKDCSKVDRSAAYAARWAAKSLVSSGLCARCLVQVAYAIGVVRPVALSVNSFGSAKKALSDDDLSQIVLQNFDFTPGGIARDLDLKVPQFQQYSAFGHFGRADVESPWEVPKTLSAEPPEVRQ